MRVNTKKGPDDSRRSRARSRRRMVVAAVLLVAALVNLVIAGLNHRQPGGWLGQFFRHRPAGIILHHSATPQRVNGQLIDAQFIDRSHARRGFNNVAAGHNYHIGYHYIIRGDGVVQPGRPEWMWGSHTRGHNDQLGICLIGDFSSGDNPTGKNGPLRPNQAQLNALDRLLRKLSAKYHFDAKDVHRHRDYAQTACPGDRFPFRQVVRRAFE